MPKASADHEASLAVSSSFRLAGATFPSFGAVMPGADAFLTRKLHDRSLHITTLSVEVPTLLKFAQEDDVSTARFVEIACRPEHA